MGIRFRRSKSLGPFRVTLGTQGLSFSAGVKGLRVTRRADGKTQVSAGIPGSGLYYTEVLKQGGNDKRQEPPAPARLPDEQQHRIAVPAQPSADESSLSAGQGVLAWLKTSVTRLFKR